MKTPTSHSLTEVEKARKKISELNDPALPVANLLLPLRDVSVHFGIPIPVLQAWAMGGRLKCFCGLDDDVVAEGDLMGFLRSEAAGEYRIFDGSERQIALTSPRNDAVLQENEQLSRDSESPRNQPERRSTKMSVNAKNPRSVSTSETGTKSSAPSAAKAGKIQNRSNGGNWESSSTEPSVLVETQISLHRVIFDVDTQVRAASNLNVVGQYAALMRQGTKFPAVDLFSDEAGNYYIGDGHHRLEAAKLCKREEFHARVWPGGKAAARMFALSANHGHGLRLTSRDKRRAIGMAFAVHPDWSNNQIAKLCQVSEASVRKHRSSFVKSEAGKRLGADGKSYATPVTNGAISPKKLTERFGDTKYYVRNLSPEMRVRLIHWMFERFPGDFHAVAVSFPKKPATS